MATILFLGRLRESVGAGALTVTLPAGVRDTERLRDWLAAEHPALREPSVRIAVNAELHPRQTPLDDGDEIAFLPPVSGG
ncbi:MAG: molybdopterin converting factor subunit 1 [Alphaproteobacteria bacterium]|nr:molybdopterin converting factor subunit 1 [Alphaproteobacteria bacterium]